ncbi:PKD domain-containing protein [Phaeodactylibacter xiamenensis]|uniref:PKD domain-containing protein n=1 Tax=Phaeodactylibacter xiamenensis TaxID=1524460 RepID=UPI0024A7F7E6|nr:PKD domain-containing protein [Phaeodactylibacter xiamenensis]
MTRLFPIALSCCFILSCNLAFSQPFSATSGMSDSYIDVEWDLSQVCFEDASNNDEAYEDGVFLELTANGVVIYTEIIDEAMPGPVDNVYRHFVGPGRSINYELVLYEIGPGDEITAMGCSSLTATGGTLAFQPPVGVTATDATRADAVELTWTNKSELSSSFQVIRKVGAEETVAAIIPGTSIIDSVFTFEDNFLLGNQNSLENGIEYEYCIRTFSELVDSTFSETDFSVCDQGSTYDINFQASDFAFSDRVEMTWDDVSAFADKLVIRRDGEVIEVIEVPSVTQYVDSIPTYGLNSLYTISLLVDEEGDVIQVQDQDMGGVDPIGNISGFVRGEEGVGLSGVKIFYEVEVLDSVIQDSTITDYTGAYTFSPVFFGRTGNFTITPSRPGEGAFLPASQEVTLDVESPVALDINFSFRGTLSTGPDSIAVNSFTSSPGDDVLNFSWSYFSDADTTHFQLYRYGTLIGIEDDADGLPGSITDRTGKPGHFYVYELRAYSIRNDSFTIASVKDTIQFPEVTAPENLIVQDDFSAETEGILTLSWTHTSNNYDGFQVYRNDSLIAMLDQGVTFFSDYTGIPGAVYDYNISAFRKFNGPVLGEETFESAYLGSDGNLYPPFFEPDNVNAAPQVNENAVLVSWDVPVAASTIDNYSGFKVYRDGVEIGTILKGDDYEFLDLQGLPGAGVEYAVRTFVLQPDTLSLSSGTPAANNPVNFPVIEAPVINSVVPALGKATVNLGAGYSTANSNFDGFVFYADGVPFDTVDVDKNSATYYPNTTGGSAISINFEARAFRNINGRIFTSDADAQTASVPLGNNPLEAPGNINASEHFPMHVALTWTYPIFKLSRFVVYRDGVALDTLPTTARAYYDYDVLVSVRHEYAVQAIYEGAASISVYDQGSRLGRGYVIAHIDSDANGRQMDSLRFNILGSSGPLGAVFTNESGTAVFDCLPVDSEVVSFILDTEGRTLEVPAATLSPAGGVSGNDIEVLEFEETFEPSNAPPLPRVDSVAAVVKVSAQALKTWRQVVISWSVSEGRYDGFEVYRGLAKIADVQRREPNYVIDSTGVGGIEYLYTVRPYYIDNGDIIRGEEVGAFIAFPALQPVENLTATVGYFGDANTLNLNWSHPKGDVSYYQLTRNDEVIGIIQAGEQLTFEDKTGKPGQTYNYTVRAILIEDNGLVVSDPKSVTVGYPVVGDPALSLLAVQDSNAVRVEWTYMGEEVDGFRVLRDNNLIATLDPDERIYWDKEGSPESVHEYTVISLLNRDGMEFQSEGAMDTITYPKLKPVVNLMAMSVDSLGNAMLSFEYYAGGVDRFEMMYDISYTDANNVMQDSSVMLTLFPDQLEDNILEFEDELAIPQASIDYMVKAVSVRDGVTYFSDSETATIASYPRPPMPMNLVATDGTYENRVELSWDSPLEANIDFFEVRRGNTVIGTVEGGLRKFTDVFNGIGNDPSGTYTYTVVAYRSDYGVNFPSVSATDSGYPGLLRKGYNVLSDANVTSSFGWDVAADQNNVIVGSPLTGRGFASFFTKNSTTNEWDLKLSYSHGNDATWTLDDYGYSVDVVGGEVAVGAPRTQKNGDINWGWIDYIPSGFTGTLSGLIGWTISTDDSRFGEDVAVTGNRYYTTREATGNNEILSFAQPSTFNGLVTQPANTGSQDYVSMDASDSYVVAGATTTTTSEAGFVDIFRRDGNVLVHANRTEGEENGDEFGTSIYLEGNFMAVGATGSQGGKVYIYQIKDNGTTADEIQQITPPGLDNASDTDKFGSDVSLSGKYLLVGARNHQSIESGVSDRTGLAFLYEKSGNTFDYVDVLSLPDGTGDAGDDYGFSVAASTGGFFVGAPYWGSDGGAFYYSPDLLELWNQKLISVTASDGQFSNRTRVAWEFTGNRDYINGFNIYRDDELIHNAAFNESVYMDTDGVPGREYTYKVKVLTTEDRESIPKSDKGFRKAIGVFEGDVFTAIGSAPVPGVTITAEGIINGEKYEYSGLTDVNGHFYIDGVFFADETVNYTLTASYLDHVFLVNPIPVVISPDNPVKSNIIFIDNTAFIAQGTVAYEGVSCGLDSITVRSVHRFSNGSESVDEVMTDEEGKYSLVLQPGQAGLEEIRIEIDSFQIRSDVMGNNADTILHLFKTDSATVFTDFSNFRQNYQIDFVDTLTYEAEFFVTTVCGLPASSNGSFNIEISRRDGCYQQIVATNNISGKVTANLPPLDDLVVTVRSGVPATVENLLITDYLRYRPTEIDLERTHIDNFKNDYSQEVLDSLLFTKLVYHKPATIDVSNEIGELFCGDASEPRILRQNSNYNLTFSVEETINGLTCSVDEGFLVVTNAAAKSNTRDTLNYLPELNGFEKHLFTAGAPNLVAPFRKGVNIKYFSAVGDLLSEVNIPFVITGSAPLPGSDVIVDIRDQEGQIKLPIYVLRDPYGDGSFSSIEEGTTITKSLTELFSFRGGAGVVTDLKFAVGTVGLFLEIDALAGGSTADEDTYELSITTTQEISTSATSDFVGPDADVLVGIGASTQYGLIEEVRYLEDSCKFVKVQTIDITLNEIKTDWFYTVGQIKQLRNEKLDQVDQVRDGTLELQVNGEVLDTTEAIGRLSALANNWQAMLDYHARESVPYYQLCAEQLNADSLWDESIEFDNFQTFVQGLDVGVFGEEPDDFTPDADPDEDFITRIQNARDARAGFCGEIGSYNAQDSFILNQPLDEVIFTTDLAERYEEASRAVDLWVDSLYLSIDDVEERISDITTLEGIFPEVENTTFSAGVDVTKTRTVNRTTSSKWSTRGFVDFSLILGGYLKARASGGFGLITDIAVAENKLGGQIELNFEWGKDRYNSKEVESTISYTLSDDDPGDQFSVTAIKGRDPGHTPYFQLLGGRSSCPPEEGTILRDIFDISLYDPETESTFDSQELLNLNPDEPAEFFVQLTNLNPFGEQRDLFVYHEGESNENGATLRLNGGLLGGGNQSGQTLTFINPNQPIILPLTLTRSVNNYQFDSIYVVLRPSCTDGDLFLLGQRDTVTISANFDYPCSDISIASPGNDWLISRRNPFLDDSFESLSIEIRDYEADNPALEEIYLEYRRIGDGSGWERIPTSQLDPNYVVKSDSLVAYNEENFGPGQIPKFFFVWDITELYEEYPDGIYEVRAISFCGTSGEVQSNIIRGQIRRQTGDVFALTEPADGIWQAGDEISIKVNKELDCAQLGNFTFEVTERASGNTVPGEVFCFANENKLVFQPDNTTLLDYDGQILDAIVYDLEDEVGNRYLDTFRWEFRVVARDIFVQDTLLETTIYQDSEGELNTVIFYNDDIGFINYVTDGNADYPWLTVDPTTGSVPAATGRAVTFTIDGSQLPVGDTTAVIRFVSTSGLMNQGVDSVRIKVNVLAKPPYWVVDPSQYATSTPVITNFEFTNAPGVTSRDTMDIISAWIGNEIRGVARISSTQVGQYAAFMLVYGDPEDIGTPLEFRVWDANEGREYNGYPVDSLFFDDAQSIGSFGDPEILMVDRNRDLARYIPVNGEEDGGGGITWLSFNSQEEDMAVDEQLRELKFLQNGDIIKTENKSAGYVEGIGWLSTNGLDSIEAEEGYILFLGGVDDTIRVTGMDAEFRPIILEQGWNLVGAPVQDTIAINDAFNVSNISNGDFLTTVAQDPTLPGLSANMVAQYDQGLSQWLFGLGSGMEVIRPNFAYQIRVAAANAVMLYDGATSPLTAAPVSDGSGERIAAFVPSDPSTWSVDPSEYPSSMVVTGVALFDEVQSLDQGDKIAAYVNGECRGAAHISHIPALGDYMAPMFIYGTNAGDVVEILMYDASEGQVYLAKETLVYEPNGIVGSFTAPYAFENQTMSAIYERVNTYCEADTSGSLSVTMVSGLTAPYTYEWSNGASGASLAGLSSGDYSVTITGQEGISFVDTLVLENLEIAIPAPTVELSTYNPACSGTDVVLHAMPPNQEATVIWQNSEGEILEEGNTLLLEHLQSQFTAYASTVYRGCQSEPLETTIDIYEPDAGFTIAPPEELTTATAVQFLPGDNTGSFAWSFGDGAVSNLVAPLHQYELPGHYQASLARTDLAGCTGYGLYDIWVGAATQTLELPEGKIQLQATPNPFSHYLDVMLDLPYGGSFELELLSISGQRIERIQSVWEAGKRSIRLTPDISDGTYLLQLRTDRGHRLALPIIKQSPRP